MLLLLRSGMGLLLRSRVSLLLLLSRARLLLLLWSRARLLLLGGRTCLLLLRRRWFGALPLPLLALFAAVPLGGGGLRLRGRSVRHHGQWARGGSGGGG